MRQKEHVLLFLSCLGSCVLLVGCGKSPASASLPPSTVSLETDPTELRELKTIAYVPAEKVTGPNGRPFFVKTRTDQIVQYPCSSCHEESKPLAPNNESASSQSMHVDIELVHASPDSMDCLTCHSADAPGTLHTLNGKPIAIDHAYQLCSQCHFEQGNDWAGGAHGKRLAGWKGKRVINNCTECHDPHSPAFAARIPELGPLIPRSGDAHHE